MAQPVQIQLMREYDEALLRQCIELDNQVYAQEWDMDFGEESAILKANPRSRVLAYYEGELIGYYSYQPLTEEAFELFLNCRDDAFEHKITPAHIAPWSTEKPTDLYIGSIVVSPKMQGKMISLVLMRGLLRGLRELEAEGRRIGRVGGTGVSSGGVYSLQNFLDMRVSHEVPGGTAMVGDGAAAMARLDEYVGF